MRRGCSFIARGVFLLFPMVFLVIGLWTLIGTVSILIGGDETIGTVVGHEVNSDSDGTTYQPIITFRTDDGEDVTFTELVGRSSVPDVGTEVDVLYYPDDPSDAREVSFIGLWAFPLAFTGVGLIFPGLWLRSVLRNRGRPDSPFLAGEPAGTAWYRRTETEFDGDERRYVVVGVDDDGVEIRSEQLDSDPSAEIIQAGSRIEIITRGGERTLRV